MQKAGLDCGKMQGYGFKGNSKNANKVANGDFKCEHCGSSITSQEASYSQANYSIELCRKCQVLAKKGELNGNSGNEQQNQGTEAKQN
jgi:ribosomal protein L37AE/L43A